MKNSFKETDCLTKENIIDLHKCCEAVAEKVLKIYNKPLNVTYKKDQTPLSEADKCSHELLTAFLKKNFPTIPILSEEMSEITPFELRKEWAQFWLVDPLDGTKEFIKKNGQFCFCIALIRNNVPVFGFIHAPTTGVSYYGVKEYGAYKITDDNLNLGIHEFMHAMQLEAMQSRDVDSLRFQKHFQNILKRLTVQEVRDTLDKTRYFRNYAFTNQYEFMAVLAEYFIESPNDFKEHFPELYKYTRQLLNFTFAGY